MNNIHFQSNNIGGWVLNIMKGSSSGDTVLGIQKIYYLCHKLIKFQYELC